MVKRYCGGNRGARETELGSPRMWGSLTNPGLLTINCPRYKLLRYIFISGDIKLLQPLSVWILVPQFNVSSGRKNRWQSWSCGFKLAAYWQGGWKSTKRGDMATWESLASKIHWPETFCCYMYCELTHSTYINVLDYRFRAGIALRNFNSRKKLTEKAGGILQSKWL